MENQNNSCQKLNSINQNFSTQPTPLNAYDELAKRPCLTVFTESNSVDIWSQKLPVSNRCLDQLADLLSTKELIQAHAYYHAKDRDRSIVSRGFLRLLISHYMQLPAQDVPLCFTPYGKPCLAHSRFSFNLSHSGDYLVYAFGKDAAIGIDIEEIKPIPDILSLFESCLTFREQSMTQKLNAEDQLHAFYQIFTRKEAYCKAVGVGLSHPLNTFDLYSVLPNTIFIQSGRAWKIFPFSPHPNYAGHLVVGSNSPAQETY